MEKIIAPSLLAADFLNLETEIKKINETSCEWLHLDVMDGNFVPNLTFGYDLVGSLRPLTDKFFDVHLMISNPQMYVKQFQKAGAELYTFHYEAVNNEEIPALIEAIKAANMKVGMSIKPGTEVADTVGFLKDLDLVLVMSVEPGFGGQAFQAASVEKIAELNELRKENNYEYLIQVDGGINNETGVLVSEAGCDVLVAGSYVFKEDMEAQINSLR